MNMFHIAFPIEYIISAVLIILCLISNFKVKKPPLCRITMIVSLFIELAIILIQMFNLTHAEPINGFGMLLCSAMFVKIELISYKILL